MKKIKQKGKIQAKEKEVAYTIISQNNSTTTLSDGVNTITVPSRVNLTSGNFTIVEVNNNMATLEDGDGNVYRDIPCVATLAGEGGGGGGSGLPDQTGHSGEFLTTDGTDASWSDITKVNTTITLAVAGWSSNTQTVSVTGVTATGVVFVSPDPTDQSAYTSAGIICSAQAAGTLTFTCSTTPSADLSVNVVML